MSARAGSCPSCGAPVEFAFAQAVQTSCPYCRSVLVRHDVALELVGERADFADDASPVQLGASGTYRRRPFTVVGRIAYGYERGGWNEWHLAFADGASGWLSDAQLDWAVSFLKEGADLPAAPPAVGERVRAAGTEMTVTSVTRARYRGVEGELPFTYWGKQECAFADLGGPDARFGTIDYSDGAPILFVGEYVPFAELALTGLREFQGW